MNAYVFEAKLSVVAAIGVGGAGAIFAMTDAVSISIITSTGAVIMASVSSFFAYKAKTIAEQTHQVTNSRMTELLALAKVSSKQEGVLQEKMDEAGRQSQTKKENPK